MKRNDWMIIIGIIVIAAGIYLWNNFKDHNVQPNEKFVEVYFKGELYDRVNIMEHKEIVVETELGRNIILVDAGKVEMIDADCPDKICLKTGEIHQVGRNIVCLPNKVHVEVVGRSEEEVDAIVQ